MNRTIVSAKRKNPIITEDDDEVNDDADDVEVNDDSPAEHDDATNLGQSMRQNKKTKN